MGKCLNDETAQRQEGANMRQSERICVKDNNLRRPPGAAGGHSGSRH